MPRFEFWHSDTEAIACTFDRHPMIGEEIVLGDRGIFRIVSRREERDSGDEIAYKCEFVREATLEDLKAVLERGVNTLPPLPS